jgi:hypothetical protein
MIPQGENVMKLWMIKVNDGFYYVVFQDAARNN